MFNLSKIKDAFCFWIKKLVNSNVFPILWGILTLIIALSLAFIFSFVTNNFFILYLIVEITIFAMLIILCEIIISMFRYRSIILKKGIMYGIWILLLFIGFVIFSLITPYELPELFLSFLGLLLATPSAIEFVTKNQGLWRILIYPKTKDVDLDYRDFSPSFLLSKKSKFNINIRNLKNVDASITFFGIFNDQQFNNLKNDLYLWKTDFFLKNYAKIKCIKRIEDKYENVSSFGQSKTNVLLFIPSKSYTKFYIQLNKEKHRTAVSLNKDELKDGITLHFVYLDIFNKIYDYSLIIKKK